MYWGFLLSLVLAGVNAVQGFRYFPSRDAIHLQAAAVFMILLNFAASALVSQSVYYYLIAHYGSLIPFHSITKELAAECLCHTLITFISQGYFAAQLYGVAKMKPCAFAVPIVVAVCAVISCGFGIVCTAMMVVHSHNVLEERSSTFSLFFGLAKGGAALTDILATAAMCALLAGARTGMRGTNAVIATLVQYVIRRGVLVALVQTLLLVTFFAAPSRLYWLVFHVNVTKLYATTFFSMLNAREGLHAQRREAYMSYAADSRATHEGGGTTGKSRAFFSGTRSSRDTQGEVDGVEMDECEIVVDGKRTPLPVVTRTVVIREL